MRPLLIAAGGLIALTAVIVAVAVLAGGSDTDGGSPPTANLWVDPDGGACTRSAEKVEYSDEAACGSLDAANDKCAAGDVALVSGGTYQRANQTITGANGRSAACTIEAADPKDPPLMKRLELSDAQWVTIRGIESLLMDCSNGTVGMCRDNTLTPENRRAVNISTGTEDVVLEDLRYGGFNITDSRRVTIRDSEFGPCNAFDGRNPGGGSREGCPNGPIQYCAAEPPLGCTGYNEGHLIEGNRFFDFGCDATFFDGLPSNETKPPKDDCHHECMYVSYAKDLTIRANVFQGCANGGNIFHTFSNGGGEFTADFGFTNYTVENNVFEQSCDNSSSPCGGRVDGASGFGHCEIYSGADFTNVKIRFNTFLGGSTFNLDIPCQPASGRGGLHIYGNLLKRTSVTCGPAEGDPWNPLPAIEYNLYSGSDTCGTNATNVGQDLSSVIKADANARSGDPHLVAGTNTAVDYVPITADTPCPERDFEGDPRPESGSCDAGADER